MSHVESIWIADAPAAPMRCVDEVRVEPGRGLEGDRYFDGRGTFSTWPGTGRALTLVAAEAIEAAEAALGTQLPPGATRRNVVTRGVDLDALIGHEFTVGGVRVRGMRRCEPCEHLAGLLGDPRVLRAFVGRGGLRCDVLTSGEVRVGDAVRRVEGGAATPTDGHVACEVPKASTITLNPP